MAADRGQQRNAGLLDAIETLADFVEGGDFDHHMDDAHWVGKVGQREAVVAGVAGVHKANTHFRCALGRWRQAQVIAVAKAQQFGVEGVGGVDIGCGNNGVAEAHIAGDKLFDAQWRLKGCGAVVAAGAGVKQFERIAGGVDGTDIFCDTAQRGAGGITCGDGGSGGLQFLDQRIVVGFRSGVPTGGQ